MDGRMDGSGSYTDTHLPFCTAKNQKVQEHSDAVDVGKALAHNIYRELIINREGGRGKEG